MGPFQPYGGRLPPRRASDAETIDNDAYGADPGADTEVMPQGLVDRLYQEQLTGQPVRGRPGQAGAGQPVPTTRNRFS